MQKKNMDWRTFEIICNQIGEFKDRLKQINFAGWGEPTINIDLPRMVSHLKKHNIVDKVSVITNGSLLNEYTGSALVDSGVDYIKISLQGMKAEKYSEICGFDLDFEEFVSKIRRLYKSKKQCQVYVKVADIAISENEEEAFYSTFKDISDRMYIENIRPIFEHGNNDIGINKEQMISKYGYIHSPVIVCPQPFFMMNITETGDVYPCCSYHDPTKLGNIHNISLLNIWNSPSLRNFQIMMLNKRRYIAKNYPVCRECKIPDAIVLPEDDLDTDADKILKRF